MQRSKTEQQASMFAGPASASVGRLHRPEACNISII